MKVNSISAYDSMMYCRSLTKKRRRHYIKYCVEPFGWYFDKKSEANDAYLSKCGTLTMYGYTKDGECIEIKSKTK